MLSEAEASVIDCAFEGDRMELSSGVGRVLGDVEESEWFEWMRRELVAGGLDPPSEEVAVSFAGHALRLRDRIRILNRHVPRSLERRLIESAIIYQCWRLNKRLYATAKWPGANCAKSLVLVDAVEYIRPIGIEWGHHLIRARDDFQYIITVPSGFPRERRLATQVICNTLSRSLGLTSPGTAIVSIGAEFLKGHADDSRGGREHQPRRGSELCTGFRHVESSPWDNSTQENRMGAQRNMRQMFGSLVVDIWTVNVLPRQWSSAINEVTGKMISIPVDNNGGLAGGDWLRFLDSEIGSLAAPQAIAAKLRRWEQLDPWISRAISLDWKQLWDIAFQMPPEWYGRDKEILAKVLEKLGTRAWELPRALHHFVRTGYFPGLTMPPSRADTAGGGEVASVTE